jgi:hypothetical protein
MANEAEKKKNHKDHRKYLGDLRECARETSKTEESSEYGQQKKGDDIV